MLDCEHTDSTSLEVERIVLEVDVSVWSLTKPSFHFAPSVIWVFSLPSYFFLQSFLKVGDPRKGETEVMELFSLSFDKLPPDAFRFGLPLLAGVFDIRALWYASQSEQLLSLCSWKVKTSSGITMSFQMQMIHVPCIFCIFC